MRDFSTLLVTGGAGFIGSNFIRYLLGKAGFEGRVVNLDALTYAGNPENLSDIEGSLGGKRYFFERGDICDRAKLEGLFSKYGIDAVAHFAAESHVDRSIRDPEAFVRTNVMGTFALLDVSRNAWKGRDDVLFHHVSTDEVFGSLGESGRFIESSAYDPHNPYSASKASSDHLARAYFHTYGLPLTLTNCSNNYGPYQFPEKLIPFMILNMVEGKSLPVYGDGRNSRDWVHVEDHVSAIWLVMRQGRMGESYNIGGENEWENMKLLGRLMEIVAGKTGSSVEDYRKLVTFVKDRPGHDRRYAIDCSKIKAELGWKRDTSFERGLEMTVDWYLGNRDWIEGIRSGEYRKRIEARYGR